MPDLHLVFFIYIIATVKPFPRNVMEDYLLDEDQFNLMTVTLGIGRRLSDSDRKQIYSVMTARRQQAYESAHQRVERLKVELATEEARLFEVMT